MFRMDVPQGKPQQAAGWSPPMVGDFHALDKFGELVFGDAQGVVPPPAPPVAPALAKEKTGGASSTPVERARRPQGARRRQDRRRRGQEEVDDARRAVPLAAAAGRGRVARRRAPRQRGEGRGEGPPRRAPPVCWRRVPRRGRRPASTSTSASTPASASASAPRRGRRRRRGRGRRGTRRRRGPMGGRRCRPIGLRRALLAEVRAAARKLGKPAPEPDARLDWAMTELARQVRGDELPALDVVEFLLAHYGLVEPSPHILLSRASAAGAGRAAGARPWRDHRDVARPPTSGASGSASTGPGDTIYVVVGLQETPRRAARRRSRGRLPPGGQASIQARVAAGLANPGVVVTAPDGTVRQQRPPLRDGVIRDVRPLPHGRPPPGRDHRRRGRRGSTVLANFPALLRRGAARRRRRARRASARSRSPPRRPRSRCWR